MPTSRVEDRATARHRPLRFPLIPDAVEGQVAEICRDLAVQAKHLRQLQEQAAELRVALREWARQCGADSDREPANRGGRR